MELIQIIESSVFIFGVGLVVFLILSYILYKLKDRSSPKNRGLFNDKVSIVYEKPIIEEPETDSTKDQLNERFIIINELLNNSFPLKEIKSERDINSRFYIYKPGRNKILNELEVR